MSYGLLIAAALLVGVSFAHSYLGERYILMRLFRRKLPSLFGSDWFTKQTLRFAWHITSIAWLGFGAQLALFARDENTSSDAILLVIATTFLVSAVVAAIASRGRHLAWPVFLAIAVLAWLSAS